MIKLRYHRNAARVLFIATSCFFSNSVFSQDKEPVPVIFDTDMGPDYDDVGAIALLHAFADKGEAEILATIASTKYEGVAAVLNVLNTYFGKPEIPIAVPKGQALELKDFQHWTDTLIDRYPHQLRSNNEVTDAVTLYRKTLSTQPDNSVTIITVGFLTNIANLLKSTPDQHSKLNGTELVRKKVKKLVSMAGKFPSGLEFNIEEDAAAAKYTFDNFPKPVLFSGYEIGARIKSGLPLVKNTAIIDSPVKDVFRICIPLAKEDARGRMSWDQTAVLVAIRGHEPWYTLNQGRIVLADDGYNQWDDSANGHHYLMEKLAADSVTNIINALMMHQPALKK